MNTLTKELALKVGGKVWVKEELERVYLNVSAVFDLVKDAGYSSALPSKPSKKMIQAKTYLDLNTMEIKSDVGAIRSILNQSEFKCEA